MSDVTSSRFDVLLIEDDEDDFLLTQELLDEIPGGRYRLTWVENYEDGLAAVRQGNHRACLLDVRLGGESGLDLLQDIRAAAPGLPVIMLTGYSDRDLDFAAMTGGADDYLSKGDLSSILLDRSIRYAVERRRNSEERRTMEARLSTMKHLESLGALAGGVAHEINNVLTVVQAEVVLLQEDCESGDTDSVNERVQAIREAARKGGAFVAELVGYSRQRRLEPRRLDLNARLRRLAPVVRKLLPDGATLELSGDSDIEIVADAGSMDLLVRGVAETAANAMTGHDSFHIEVLEVDASQDSMLQRFHQEGDYVLLRFEYTGATLSSEELDRVFEPAFSANGQESPAGLGMAMIYGLVKQHDGYIDVESGADGSNTVKVWLPRGDLSASQKRPEHAQEGTVVGGSETVLVVDDEARLRRAAGQILRRLGYNVLEASNGVEGLEVFHRHDRAVDLILTDIVMPEADGTELFSRVKEAQPVPKFLFMSGYSATQLSTNGLLGPEFPLLEKPWELEELAAQVRGILDHPQELPDMTAPSPPPTETVHPG